MVVVLCFIVSDSSSAHAGGRIGTWQLWVCSSSLFIVDVSDFPVVMHGSLNGVLVRETTAQPSGPCRAQA